MAERGIFHGHKPLPAALAILFLALLLASLAARFWASERAYRFSGPTHIAAGSDQVWLFAAGDLFRLSEKGELMGVYSSLQTGLASDPIDLKVLTDGRLLLAEQRPARVRLCEPEGWDCESILEAAVSGIERQFKIIPGLRQDTWLLTDARADSLWGTAEAGDGLHRLVPAGTLAGPNELAFDSDEGLWIADTDNRRVIEFLAGDGNAFTNGRVHSAVNDLTVGTRWFPMMLAITPDQRLWVAQAADFSKPWSDLVVYDREKGAQALIDLPEGAYATDVAVLGDQVLVTDLERYVVYRVDSENLAVSTFGNDVFNQAMSDIHQSHLEYDSLGRWTMVSLSVSAVLMLLFAVLATPKGKRLTRPQPAFNPEGAVDDVPETRRVYWLERNPRIERNLKWGEIVFHISLIGLVLGILLVYALLNSQTALDPGSPEAAKANELGIILLLGGVMLALLVPVVRLSVRAVSRRLGTDGKRLYIQLEDGRELAVNPADLLYTNRTILYRRYLFPLQGGKGQALYLPGELDTWLAPLLRESRRVSWIESIKYQWKHQESLLIWSLLAAIAASSLLVTLLMTEF